MVPTIKLAISDTLKDLSKSELDTFIFHLRDRREEPLIRRSSLEGKNLHEVTDLLVSTFTELGAKKVTMEILRQINCNEQAEKLDSKTKACTDKGDPTFRKISDRELETKPSQEALNYRASRWPSQAAQHGGPPVKKPEEVEAEAKAQIRSEGGDLSNERLVLSRYKIQFGQYRGQPFKWLLENDVGYTAFIVASHQKEHEHTMHQSPLMANKDSFTRYATAYPEILTEVRFHRAYENAKAMSLQPGQEGKALVGFGIYRWETLQGLYTSKNDNKISYVNFLRNKSTWEPGSKMEAAIKYIVQRDRQRARGRPTRGRSARHQPTSVSRPIQRYWRRSWRKTPTLPR
ncbi:uncharacterized protein LOC121906049 [Thunnus maccoyii]|uniref:uncharacterized protein LOC121906049 n=1 Tax=Thunnus maccoyii TaxID=8240 RepID=UPI001C4CA646|nr:uncharacterized protein LOC121906049 [Thunnus maccoyii]